MGRIKTKLIKRAAEDILNKNKDIFKNNFNENKKIMERVVDIRSKKIRNAISGYLVRLIKRGEKAS